MHSPTVPEGKSLKQGAMLLSEAVRENLCLSQLPVAPGTFWAGIVNPVSASVLRGFSSVSFPLVFLTRTLVIK